VVPRQLSSIYPSALDPIPSFPSWTPPM
jgi:hypothetical protein